MSVDLKQFVPASKFSPHNQKTKSLLYFYLPFEISSNKNVIPPAAPVDLCERLKSFSLSLPFKCESRARSREYRNVCCRGNFLTLSRARFPLRATRHRRGSPSIWCPDAPSCSRCRTTAGPCGDPCAFGPSSDHVVCLRTENTHALLQQHK
jgi:hypothetical protein